MGREVGLRRVRASADSPRIEASSTSTVWAMPIGWPPSRVDARR